MANIESSPFASSVPRQGPLSPETGPGPRVETVGINGFPWSKTPTAVAYTYFRKDENEARQANVLTWDEARLRPP